MDVQHDVEALLRGKSRCLAQLVEASRLFLESIEPAPELLGKLVTDFDLRREESFRAVELIDRRINELSPHLSATGDWSSAAREIVLQQQGLARTLQDLDARIIALIEKARQDLLRLAGEQNLAKERLGRFKSRTSPEQGDGLDRTL